MKTATKKIGEYILDAPLFGMKRPSRAVDDFGDNATVGKHLKRTGKKFNELGDRDYGRYLGRQDEGYVVGIKNFETFDIVDVEIFDTPDELKVQWELD